MRSRDWGRFDPPPHLGYPQCAERLPVARGTIFGNLSRGTSIVIGSGIGVVMDRLLVLGTRLLGERKYRSRRISRRDNGREDIERVGRTS